MRLLPRSLAPAVALALAAAVLSASPAPAHAAVPGFGRAYEAARSYDRFNPQGTIDQAMSSPAVGDVGGDATPEVVVGGMDGRVMWANARTGAWRTFDVDLGGMIQASPVLTNLDGDPQLEVVVATVRRVPGASRVFVIDDLAGSPHITFVSGSFPFAPDAGFLATPAVGDITGDGAAEIVAAGFDQRVHAWHLDGQPVAGFPVFTFDTMFSSPVLADIDGDGAKEIITGGDMDRVGQPLPAGGYLWVIRGTGAVMHRHHLSDQVLWSTPAVGDLDADGDLDIVIGTGRNWGDSQQSNFLYGVDARTMAALPGWPKVLDANSMASPALANLDGDPQLEVAALSGSGRLYVFDHDGHERFNRCLRAFDPNCGGDVALLASPVIANVDGDAQLEIIAAPEWTLKVVDSATGGVDTENLMGAVSPDRHPHATANAPAVANLGDRMLIAVSISVDRGNNGRNVGDEQLIVGFTGGAVSSNLPWSHFKRDAGRSGAIGGDVSYDVGRWVDALYRDLLGRTGGADPAGRDFWVGQVRRVGFGAVAESIARQPEWVGHVVDVLYQEVLGRGPDPGGRAYWVDRIARGDRVASVAANMYGSEEWFWRAPPTGAGGTLAGYVDNLYRRILQREPDGARAYWLAQLAAGYSRPVVASAFYLSYESNGQRVDRLYAELMHRSADPAGRDYWARTLGFLDDIKLASLLVASPEYLQRNAGR